MPLRLWVAGWSSTCVEQFGKIFSSKNEYSNIVTALLRPLRIRPTRPRGGIRCNLPHLQFIQRYWWGCSGHDGRAQTSEKRGQPDEERFLCEAAHSTKGQVNAQAQQECHTIYQGRSLEEAKHQNCLLWGLKQVLS